MPLKLFVSSPHRLAIGARPFGGCRKYSLRVPLPILLGLTFFGALLGPLLCETKVLFAAIQPKEIHLRDGRTALFIPHGASGPLLMFLHAAQSNAYEALNYSGFAKAAQRHDVSIAFGESRDGIWRYHGLNGSDDRSDEAYVLEMREALLARGFGSQGFFIAGMSNGSLLAIQIACRHPDLFQGVAMISGGVPEAVGDECKMLPPNVVIVNGTADPIFPLAGGGGYHPQFGSFWGFDRTAAFLLGDRRCGRYDEAHLTTAAVSSPRSVVVMQATACRRDGVTELYRVENGGHESFNESGWRVPWTAMQSFNAPENIVAAFVNGNASFLPGRSLKVRQASE